MLTIKDVTLQLGARVLLDKANFSVYDKQKIGLVGNNGTGKTSLFRMMIGDLSPDKGEILKASQCKIGHLAQEVPALDVRALDYVSQGDEEWFAVQSQIDQALENEDHDALAGLYITMQDIDGYSVPARAAELLDGLGFTSEEMQQTVASFSGGWRMRLNLARILIGRFDLLLLDEPTNHLDLEAILWLEKWLAKCTCAVMLISHDRDFLDNVVTHILHIENQGIKLYKGSYSTFEETRAMQLSLQQAAYQKQQAKISHALDFVRRFKAKASKAKQAQSRMKMVERMEKVAAVHANSPFQFTFSDSQNKSNPLLVIEQGGAAYDDKIVWKNVNLSILAGTRMGILGENGAGKTTLLKTLAGRLKLQQGIYQAASGLRIGYFAQHQVDELVLGNSPLQHLKKLDPNITEQTFRTFLGSFNFIGDQAVSPITHFSGGEKARLALAILAWQKPDLLLLDEPTNHLDMEVREALVEALLGFNGAMLVISHDRYLLRSCVDEFCLIHNHGVTKFDGDLDDYREWWFVEKKKMLAEEKKGIEKKPVMLEKKDTKKIEAKLKKIEDELAHVEKLEQAVLLKLDEQDIYDEKNKSKLEKLIAEKEGLSFDKKRLQDEWFLLSEELDVN